MTLQPCHHFKEDRTYRPHRESGHTPCEMTTGDKLANNRTYLHRRCCIILLIPHFQVPRIDTAALFEKIADGERTLVVDNTGRFIDQLVAESRNNRLYGYFVDRTIRQYTGNNIAKSNDLTE